MAEIIAIAGQKGGTGKSTIAACIACYWHALGFRVLLIDADPQATLLAWAGLADESNRPRPDVVAMGEGLRKDALALADRYDYVIIDCPGRAGGKRTNAALLVADLVVLPTGPCAPDIWALTESIDSILQAQELRPELVGRLMLNRSDRTVTAAASRELLKATKLPPLFSRLGSRVAFGEALAGGMGVSTYAPSSIAALELRRLAMELDTVLEATRHAA